MSFTPEAVFIGGCPRSGTTLLASLLGGLPGCVVTPESQFKHEPLRTLQHGHGDRLNAGDLYGQLSGHLRFRHWGVKLDAGDLTEDLGATELGKLLLTLVRRFGEASGAGSKMTTWIDHTPQNIEAGLALTRVFPNARLIHVVRDPRAVAASLLPLDWGPHSPEGVAALWSHRLAHGLALEQAMPERILRIHYEQLCLEPDNVMQRLSDWLAIPLPDGPVNPGRSFLPSYTHHQHRLVGTPPRPDRIEAWRRSLTPWQQRLLEKRLDELMTMMGYVPDARPMQRGERQPGAWERWLGTSLHCIRGRIRHRLHQRIHGGGSR